MRNLRLESSRLQEDQNKKLRAIVKHAYEHVPFYRRKFDNAGLKPDDIMSAEDLHKLPMTTKDEIQGTPLSDIIPKGINVNDCIKGVTSGSCGVPLTVFIDKKAEDFRLALWGRAWLENSWRPWDKMAILKIPKRFQSHRRWIERHGLLKRKEISVFENVQHQAKLIEFYKPDVLKGYSSSLAILADFCSDRKHGVCPRSIFAGAELLHEKDRKLMSSVFGCDVLDYYGSIEFSLLAWECQNHLGYHMNMDGTVMEFVNNGEVVAPG
jgi:phenylacetate-CoA ligase